MQTRYYLTGILLVGLLAAARPAAAQDYTVCPTDQDECVVEWANEEGLPIMNALTNTVANDTERPAGRIYKLKRGGFYWITEHISNNEFNLRLIGQTAEEGAATGENVCGESGTEDCGPAIIQRFRREDGTVDGLMIESSGDGNGGLELRNLWLMGQDDSGVTANYEPSSSTRRTRSSSSTMSFSTGTTGITSASRPKATTSSSRTVCSATWWGRPRSGKARHPPGGRRRYGHL